MTEIAPEAQSAWGRRLQELLADGLSYREIAQAVGCTISTLSRMRNDPRYEPLHGLGESFLRFYQVRIKRRSAL